MAKSAVNYTGLIPETGDSFESATQSTTGSLEGIDARLGELGSGKADLISGKVPLEQLSLSTQSTNGLMSAFDKKKLDKKTYTFDTVADMQSATWLVETNVAEALGNNTKGDGYGRKYIVKTSDDGTNLPYGTGLWFNKFSDEYLEKGGYLGTAYSLKELVDLKQNATDNLLTTTDKTIVGAINELKSTGGVSSEYLLKDGYLGTANDLNLAIQSVSSGTPKGAYNTLTDLQTAFPIGTTGIYVVEADGNWYYWNGTAWTSGGVYLSTNELDGVTGKNLFDNSKITSGVYLNWQTGDLIVDSLWFTSDFIPVKQNTNYVSIGGFICYYNSSKVYISGRNAGSTLMTTPSNCAYLKFSEVLGNESLLQVEEGTTPTTYEPYGYKLSSNDIKFIDDSFIKDFGISSRKINSYILNYGLEVSKNLFNKNSITEGYYLNWQTGDLIVNSLWFVSDFIPVKPNTNYAGSGGHKCFYDINKNYISGINAGTLNFTTPTNAYFFKFSDTVQAKPIIQVEEGTTPTTYEPYGFKNLENTEYGFTTIEKVVRAGGIIGVDCDYTDIKSSLDAINDNTELKRYKINVKDGTYDISNTGIEYLGLKNYVDIVGQSKKGVKVIHRSATSSSTKATFDPAYYSEAIKYSSLQNMTIISKNTKSPVHVDTDYLHLADGGTIEIINCDLIDESEIGHTHYQNGLACGLKAGQRVVGKGLWSNGRLWVHNSPPCAFDAGCNFELYNCITPFVEIADIGGYCKDKAILHNVKAKYLACGTSNPSGQMRDYIQYSFDIELEGNDFEEIICGEGVDIKDSTIHAYCTNNTASIITKGTKVSLDTNYTEISVKPWITGEILYGVAIEDIAVSDVGTVQYSGSVTIAGNGSSTPIKIGDEIELNSSGIAIKRTNGVLVGYSRSNSTAQEDIKVKIISN